MSNSSETYTYRGGEKVPLEKKADEFVVRALPEDLERFGITGAEQVSSASSRVTVREPDLERSMSLSRHVAPTHHSYVVADTDEEFLITDRVFVTFKEPLSSQEVDAFAGRYGLILQETYSDREYLFQLTDHTGMNPVKLVVKLVEEDELVEAAENDLNYRMSTYAIELPTDPFYRRQWHLHTHFANSAFDARSSARCEEAWQLLDNFGSPDVVVGVTDDGCKLDHPDFDSPGKFAGWGYFDGSRLVVASDIDAEPSKMYQSGADHGTSCAGVIAGEVDAVLTVGAAPGSRLLPIKWESRGPFLLISDSKLLTALDYVADKVDVLSNSWGGVPTTLWSGLVTKRIDQLAETGGRRGKGILFLWAAGNENCPIQHAAEVDVPYDSGWEIRPNGSAVWVGVRTARRFRNNLVGRPGVMHVAALASTAQRSHYSNYGTGILICAPTNNVHKYHRLTVRGLGITTTTGASGSVTHGFGGTSSATPLVAGVAALVISANPDLTVPQTISILKRTSAKDLNMEGYARTPSAVYDLHPDWDVSPIDPFDSGEFQEIGDPDGTWSPWFGHGRVDALAAVAEAQQLREGTSRELAYASNPDSAIPDNDAQGVRDTITVPDAGRVQDLQVSVEITHTWIGDLRVRLIAPDGADVVLHNRAGANQDDLQQTYDATLVPALATLRGKSISGDWTLQVQDLAGRDVGRLQSWGLAISVGAGAVVREDTESVRIPDRDPAGITRSLELPAETVIGEIAVSVDITHPWIGDLQVKLTHPDGTPIWLHNRAGGSADNLVRTWRSEDLTALGVLRGRDAGGAWQLNVADLAQRDEGKLNRWRIEVV